MAIKLRYKQGGECNRCGWCCLQEDPLCPYLKKEDDDTYTCTVFDDKDKRYVKCFIYPSGPPLQVDTCGYWFEDTWEDNKIIKMKV